MRTTTSKSATDVALDEKHIEADGAMTSKQKSWRDVLRIHPACDVLPLMSPDELRALAEDIKNHGLQYKIDLYFDADGAEHVLDGRNRLDAMELLGWGLLTAQGQLAHKYQGQALRNLSPEQLTAWAISANIQRRHLSPAQKREALKVLLKADPSKSNRRIAKATGVDHKTVSAVRTELEVGGEIPHLEKSVGADGVAQATTKKKPKQPEQDEPAEVTAEIIPHPGSKANGAAQPPSEDSRPERTKLLDVLTTVGVAAAIKSSQIEAIAATLNLLGVQLRSMMRGMKPSVRDELVNAVCMVVEEQQELTEAEERERRRERSKGR